MTGSDAARWRPSRAGLIGVWRFWEETFVFHRGRLLLRGPNGAGKSLALELLLPFLLDADSSPYRLTSAAKSRGGLYDRIMVGGGDEAGRTGYSWVEFLRGDEAFTVGARMRTSTSTRKVDTDYFTTSQRVGTELALLGPDRVPLSRADLVAAIGDRGQVRAGVEQHRDAVRQVLFPGFTRDRYASVITALLALRKEKLSQNLDLPKLSEVLSDALTPLDEHDLAAVAEGFERLDRRRAELEQLAVEVREVGLLADRQRDYARAVLRVVAAEVRSAETRRDNVTRDEREAGLALASAEGAAAALAEESDTIEHQLAALQVERDALRDRDAYKEGAGLGDLRAQVQQLRAGVDRAHAAADRSSSAATRADEALAAAVESEQLAGINYQQAWDDLAQRSIRVGAEATTGDLAAGPDAPPPPVPAKVRESRRVLEAWVSARRAQVTEVRRALAGHGDAVRRRGFAQERVDDDEAGLAARTAVEAAAESGLAEAARTFGASVAGWVASLVVLELAAVAAVLPRPADVPEEVQESLRVVAADQRSVHDLLVAALDERQRQLETERDEVAAEHGRLASGRDVEPVPPSWRDPRPERPGAPLWRLVETADHTPAETVDGLEASLTATGLIDAWVRPDGTVDLSDLPVDLALTTTARTGETLGAWLVPLPDSPVSYEVVTGVLHSLRTAPGVTGAEGAAEGRDNEVVLGRDGTFRLGSAVGRGPAGAAGLLGAEARRRRRLARVAELAAIVRDLDDRLAELGRERGRAEQHRRAVLAELDAAPDGRQVLVARSALGTARARSMDAAERLGHSRDRLRTAEQGVREQFRILSTVSARYGLPTQDDELGALDQALTAFTEAVRTWAHRADDADRGRANRRACAERADEAREHARAADTDLTDIRADLNAAAGRLATLDASIGTAYAEILDRLDELARQRTAAEQRQRGLRKEVPQAERAIGGLRQTLAQAETARATAEEHRAATHRQLVAAVQDGLAVDARVPAPEQLDGVTSVLTATRELTTALGATTTPGEVERTSSRVEERLHRAQEVIGGRSDLDRRLTEQDWWVLSARVGGLRRGMTELRSALQREVETGREEFAAEEERLFEQVLAGSVRRALASRIRLATTLVDGINAQLDRVRTQAGGVGVRLRWDVDPDQLAAVKSARSLLLRDPHDLSDDESGALQEFVRARVEQARAELDPTAPWEARLRESLDYRSWHRFSLQVSHRDWDGFKEATPAVLQRLSTGERSIALHLPMMASVAAHYADESAEASPCPRLILLDELFAGVDPVNRGQLFGTFTAWGLDAVLTSDHEWCQYASLDGIAIHHLHPARDGEPVTSTRFTWDGKQRRLDPGP